MTGLKLEKNTKKSKKKVWKSPQIEELGNLRDVIKATVPGKSQEGDDGGGGAAGEEMSMGMVCMD